MTKDNKVTKPCPKEEEKEKKKGDIIISTTAKEETAKAEAIPQWGLDLKASLERVVDLMERKQDPEEDKVPPKDEEEKKQDEEDKVPPKDEEEKQDDEEDKVPPKDEEKEKQDDEVDEDEEEKNKALIDMVKTEVQRVVQGVGAVELAKRGKAGDGKPKALDLFAMHGIEWSKIHKASGFPDVPDYDLTQVPGWKGQSSLLIRTRKKN